MMALKINSNSTSFNNSDKKHPFYAGAAKVDITPSLGTLINGDFIPYYVRYIHNHLYSKTLLLQDHQTTIAIIVIDICAMQKDFLDEVKFNIFSQTGICVNNILISSTHTHASPSVADLLLSPADLPYRKKLQGLIVESVKKAWQNMRPAKITFGAVEVPEHVVCRRFFMKQGYRAINPVSGKLDIVKTNPIGHEDQIESCVSSMDTELSFLGVQGIDNQWISVLANYSMHYVGDWPGGTISADYFGEFAREIAIKLNAGDDFVGIMSNGTSGEAIIWDYIRPDRYPKQHYEKSKLIGNDLADKIFQVTGNLSWETEPALSVQYEEVPFGLRKPSPDEVEVAKKIVADTDYRYLQVFEGIQVKDEGLRRIYAREQVLLHEYSDTVNFPVQALKIGTGIIGALGGEFFAETGLWLKEKMGQRNYFTIGLANGYVGYVPPAHEIEMGGYETWRCRTSFLELNAEDTIRNKVLQLITELS
jgi:neutral ceramidase